MEPWISEFPTNIQFQTRLREILGGRLGAPAPSTASILIPVANLACLQRQRWVTDVVIMCFAFHAEHVHRYIRLLAIRGEVAEVEHTYAELLRVHARALRVNEQELLDLR